MRSVVTTPSVCIENKNYEVFFETPGDVDTRLLLLVEFQNIKAKSILNPHDNVQI